MISGTVTANPSGKNDKMMDKNGAVLNGYVVDCAGKETAIGKGRGTWRLPPPEARGLIDLILRDPAGNEQGRTKIAVNQVPRVKPMDVESPNDFSIPAYVETGQPARISGFFDGDFTSSSVAFNNRGTDLLAETPGELFFSTPKIFQALLTLN